MSAPVVLIVPVGPSGRTARVRLPEDAAAWLRDQLVEALGEPKPKSRRPVRIRRGRWVNGRVGR